MLAAAAANTRIAAGANLNEKDNVRSHINMIIIIIRISYEYRMV
jgi:hypothetical protein